MIVLDEALERMKVAARAYSRALNSDGMLPAQVVARLMGELARAADEWARIDEAARQQK